MALLEYGLFKINALLLFRSMEQVSAGFLGRSEAIHGVANS
jgi:hypothetical protein